MSELNCSNLCLAVGRVVDRPKHRSSTGQNQVIRIVLRVDRENGNGQVDYIPLEAYLPPDGNSPLAPCDNLTPGTLVYAQYTVRTATATSPTGLCRYGTCLLLQSIRVLSRAECAGMGTWEPESSTGPDVQELGDIWPNSLEWEWPFHVPPEDNESPLEEDDLYFPDDQFPL